MRGIFRLRTWARHIVFLLLGAAASSSIGNGLEDNIEQSGMDLRRIELPEGTPRFASRPVLATSNVSRLLTPNRMPTHLAPSGTPHPRWQVDDCLKESILSPIPLDDGAGLRRTDNRRAAVRRLVGCV